jgi:hypothetical protein
MRLLMGLFQTFIYGLPGPYGLSGSNGNLAGDVGERLQADVRHEAIIAA